MEPSVYSNNLRRIATTLFVGSFCLSPQILRAEPDFDHPRNAIPGSRAAGFGGAYTGLSDEPAGGYYNPAGLAFARSTDISVSVNSHQSTSLRFKNIEALNGQDFVEESQTIYPSFVGSVYRFGPLHVGWSYVTLDAKNIDQTDEFPNLSNENNALSSYNRTYQEANNHFLLGGSLSIGLGTVASIGVSTYYYRRSIIASNHQLVQVTSGSFLVADQKYTTSNEGILPVIGFMARFPTVSLGLALRQGNRLSDTTVNLTDTVTYNASAESPKPDVEASSRVGIANDESNTATGQFGFAWFPSRFFTASADVIYTDGKSDNSRFAGAYALQPTINWAAGIEIAGSMASARAGYFTNNSQFREPDAARINQPAKVDYTGVSWSLGVKSGEFSGDITLVQQEGVGKAQKLSDSPDIQTVEGSMQVVQIGTRYGF